VVEKGNHSLAQRWWRTLGDDVSIAQAQVSLESSRRVGDARRRTIAQGRTTVGALGVLSAASVDDAGVTVRGDVLS